MSQHRKKNRRDSRPSSPAGRSFPGPIVLVGALAILAALGLWWWRTRQADGAPPPAQPEAAQTTKPPASLARPGATNPPAGVATPRPELQKLKGKWLRPDGGYILEIRNVDDAGKMDAAYLNPRSINVARAQASRAGTVTKVFIELRDVNYPGSTYTLVFNPERDQLQGIYFQAVEQQSFEVFFQRLK
jgi:hypothetical protein